MHFVIQVPFRLVPDKPKATTLKNTLYFFRIVYLCNRLSDNAQVIMKQIPVEDMTAEERQSALDEVAILSKLQHPNIIAHYDNFFDKTALIIIMEYAEGKVQYVIYAY